MIKVCILFILFLFPNLGLPAVHLRLEFSDAAINQGSIEEAKFNLDTETAQKIELQKLKGLNLNQTLYFHELSPLLKTSDGFSATARIIFLKVPEQKTLTTQVGDAEIIVTWGTVEIKATEAAQEFLLGQFEIPEKKKYLLWSGIILLLSIAGLFAIRFRKKILLKRALKIHRITLKERLYSPKTYADVVLIWIDRDEYLKEFPHLKEYFPDLEKVLFKYQFKQTQAESEKLEVFEAYKKFLRKVEGGFNGV